VTSRLKVRVHPGARRERVGRRMADGVWRLDVTAAPEGGRANEAVVELLARILGLRRGELRVTAGQSSRGKVVEVDGLSSADIETRLERAAAKE